MEEEEEEEEHEREGKGAPSPKANEPKGTRFNQSIASSGLLLKSSETRHCIARARETQHDSVTLPVCNCEQTKGGPMSCWARASRDGPG